MSATAADLDSAAAGPHGGSLRPGGAAGGGVRERFRALDPRLLWVILALSLLGTLTLFSAGRNTPQAGIWLKQTMWNLTGMMLMLLVWTGQNTVRLYRMETTR